MLPTRPEFWVSDLGKAEAPVPAAADAISSRLALHEKKKRKTKDKPKKEHKTIQLGKKGPNEQKTCKKVVRIGISAAVVNVRLGVADRRH